MKNVHTATVSGSGLLRRLGVLLAMTASLFAPAPTPVAGQENLTAEITVENSAFGGELTGSTGGTFRRYGLNYAGGPILLVTLDVNNNFNTMGNLLGFEIYGPDGL